MQLCFWTPWMRSQPTATWVTLSPTFRAGATSPPNTAPSGILSLCYRTPSLPHLRPVSSAFCTRAPHGSQLLTEALA